MKRPNILLVILDATRHDVCSCYGFEEGTTPALDRLADEGVLYRQAISPAPWTLPAVTSIFTGLYPGQTDIYLRRALDARFPTVAEALQRNEYATFCVTNNDWLSVDFGLQRGYDQVYKLWQIWQSDEDITNLSIIENEPVAGRISTAALKRAFQGNFFKNSLNAAYYKFLRYRRDYGARRTLAPLIKWIAEQEKPWFAFVHFLEGHLQYKPPVTFAKRFAHNWEDVKEILASDQWRLCWRHNAGVELLSERQLQAWRELYLAEVAYADYHLGQIIDWLRSQGKLDETFVVVTADHGEHLGDHGLVSHSYSLFDSLIHVPLVIRYPPIFDPGQKVTEQVQTIDLFNSMLDVAQVPIPDGTAGQSLLCDSYDRTFALSEYGKPLSPHPEALRRYGIEEQDLNHRQRGLASLRSTSHKLVVGTDGSMSLYDLQADPQETTDLASQDSGTVQGMQKRLAQYWAEHDIDGLIGTPDAHRAVDPEVERRLQDLGYLE